jgi:putative transposase
MVIADAPNRMWAVDFQFDSTTDGRPIKIVSIIEEHTRECLGGMVERSITGEHLISDLDRLAAQRGTYPAVLRCDNGPELACSAMADWAAGQVGLHFIPPGEPWRNGYVERPVDFSYDACWFAASPDVSHVGLSASSAWGMRSGWRS